MISTRVKIPKFQQDASVRVIKLEAKYAKAAPTDKRYLLKRRRGVEGTIVFDVSGSDKQYWFVQEKQTQGMAVYHADELELV